MAQQTINIGTTANDGTGDTARDAFDKANDNFDELYEQALNPASHKVNVYTADDFPAPVSGVISLESNKVYELYASINLGSDRIEMGTNTILRGVGSLSIVLTYTGTSTFITSNDNPCAIAELTISAVSSGARVVAYSTTSLKIFRMDDCTIVCDRFADFSGTSWAARLTNVSIFPFTTGAITCSGTCRSFQWFSAGVIPVAGIIIDLGTCVFDSFVVNTIVYNLPTGTTFISGLTNSGNISATGRGLVVNCQGENTGGTDLVGVDPGDARWKFSNNTPIEDSINDFLIYFDGNATDTTINTAGVYERVNLSGTYTIDHANGFTVDTATGRVTSNLVEDTMLPIDMCVSLEPVSGSNQDLAIKMAKNGVVEGPEHLVRTSNGTPIVVSIPWQSELSENDYIEVWVTNTSGTTDVLVTSCTFRGN
jgi:hypothetical protein